VQSASSNHEENSSEPLSSPCPDRPQLDERSAGVAHATDHEETGAGSTGRKRKRRKTSVNLHRPPKRSRLEESRKRKRVEENSGPDQKRLRDQSPLQPGHNSTSSDLGTDSDEDMVDEASDVSNEPAMDTPPTSSPKGGESKGSDEPDPTQGNGNGGSEGFCGIEIAQLGMASHYRKSGLSN